MTENPNSSAALGLAQGEVTLMPYNALWPVLFEQERRRIAGALQESFLEIQHVGSTAVPGLEAKPILDIAVAIEEFEQGFELVERLTALGYEFKGEYGIAGRHFFTLGNLTTHHLHMVERRSDFWHEHLLFRDQLRACEEDRIRYQALKRELAERHRTNRDSYTDGKTAFICEVLERARASVPAPSSSQD
jgi:GrpB-like predicted nucleotidyltransferase (UPF0157 family)